MDRKNRRAMIWANSRKLIEEWEDSSDFDEYGNKTKAPSLKSPLSPRNKLANSIADDSRQPRLPNIQSPVSTDNIRLQSQGINSDHSHVNVSIYNAPRLKEDQLVSEKSKLRYNVLFNRV